MTSGTPCLRCRNRGRETYRYMNDAYEFDVERARVLVADGRAPVELEYDSVVGSVRHCTIDEEHVGHVNPAYPGIIAHLYYPVAPGEEVEAHLLIDGNHRAARCLRDGRPYFVYLLTPEESRAVLLRAPAEPGAYERRHG
jgi:hypothetical protein